MAYIKKSDTRTDEDFVQGVVNNFSKKGKGYNICVNDRWYGFGFERPSCNEGDTVQFNIQRNGQWLNVDKDSFKVLKKRTAVVHSSRETVDKSGYWDKKEERDQVNDAKREIGAARNTAIELVKMLVELEALPLPKVLKNREMFLVEAVAHYTSKFIDEGTAYVTEGSTSQSTPEEDNNNEDGNEEEEVDENSESDPEFE